MDTLDPGLVFVGASDGDVYDGAARTITWVVNLTKGGSKVFYLNFDRDLFFPLPRDKDIRNCNLPKH